MALWRCRECTTQFAVGLPACPHCQSTDYEEDGAMPKITRHEGPSVFGASVVGGSWGDTDAPDVWPAPEGSEESSAGSSSETSPETPPTATEPTEKPTPKRARTTASRSKKARTGSSSAPSTDGDPTEASSATD